MYKALILKEWLKTRRVFIVLLAIAILMAVYVMLRMNSVEVSHGAAVLWLNLILKDVSMVSQLAWFPPLAGVALGVAQMAPEMSHKRLKLTLHLPCSHTSLISTMLLTGLCELLIIFAFQLAMVAIYDAGVFHSSLVVRVMLTMLPWYLSGLVSYLFVAAICVEGRWSMRLLLTLVGLAIVSVMYTQTDYMAAYNNMIWLMILLAAIAALFVFGSVKRFKEGLQ